MIERLKKIAHYCVVVQFEHYSGIDLEEKTNIAF